MKPPLIVIGIILPKRPFITRGGGQMRALPLCLVGCVATHVITFCTSLPEERIGKPCYPESFYLAAYVLKDLTQELFTQHAFGESLTRAGIDTHHKSLPVCANKMQCHFCREPFRSFHLEWG